MSSWLRVWLAGGVEGMEIKKARKNRQKKID
jgi:hypothetical protein